MLIDRLKTLLGKMPVPAGTRRLVQDARSPRDLARRLDELITENEVEFRDLQLEIEELARQESEEISRIRSGKLPDRSRKIALLRVQRLRRQQDALESRMKIHDSNMNLHIGLLEKLQSVDAMEMRGVDEAEIDSVTVEFEEEIGRYTKAMEATASAGPQPESVVDAEKERELAELEAEILGTSRREAAADESGTASGGRDGEGEKRGAAERGAARARESPARRDADGAGDDRSPGKDKEAAWD